MHPRPSHLLRAGSQCPPLPPTRPSNECSAVVKIPELIPNHGLQPSCSTSLSAAVYSPDTHGTAIPWNVLSRPQGHAPLYHPPSSPDIPPPPAADAQVHGARAGRAADGRRFPPCRRSHLRHSRLRPETAHLLRHVDRKRLICYAM